MVSIRKLRLRQKKRLVISKRCKVYFAGCVICDFWKFYDRFGKFANGDELFNFMRIQDE